MEPLSLSPSTTALILIDLQNAVVSRALAPYSGAEVMKRATALAARFRGAGAMVVYVRVDLADLQAPLCDQPSRDPNAPQPPPTASEIAPDAGMQPQDAVITKRQWNAFRGTDLEQQLHTRGVKTIVLGGIATNFGVESTARSGAELRFDVVLVEDVMASMTAEAHRFAVETIFPRLGRVRTAEQVQLVQK